MNTIKINVSSGLLQNAAQEADRIGISVQDFIRMLMGSYFSSKNSSLYTNFIAKAKMDIAAGEYTTINTPQDLKKYLKKLGV